jgi:hypothetical protein
MFVMSPCLEIWLVVLLVMALGVAGCARTGGATMSAAAPAVPSAMDNVRPVKVDGADGSIVSATIAGPTPYLPGVLGGFESYDSPRLKKMRDEYNPGAAMEGAKSEFEKILRLRHWVYTRWPVDDNCSFPYDDPFAILEEAKKTGRGFYCAHSQVVAHAVYSAYGFPSRMLYIDVDYTQKPKGGHHAINEVWCNELGKWIAIDCKYDIHFERDGVPLSALEIHEALRKDGGKGVVKRWGLEKKDPTGDGQWHGNIGSYYWVGYWLRTDFLTQSHWYLNNDYTTRLVIWDTPETRSTRWPRYHDGNDLVFEPDRHQIDWTCNLPKFFSARRDKDGKLALRFLSATPNFKEYRVRIDGGKWQTMPDRQGSFTLPLHAGENVLDCRARNLWDMDGPEVTLRVQVKPEK